MNQEIFERVKKVIVAQLGEAEISSETTAKDVEGWDSLTHVKIINGVQNEFNIKFTMSDLRSFSCVGKIVECVEKKLNSKN